MFIFYNDVINILGFGKPVPRNISLNSFCKGFKFSQRTDAMNERDLFDCKFWRLRFLRLVFVLKMTVSLWYWFQEYLIVIYWLNLVIVFLKMLHFRMLNIMAKDAAQPQCDELVSSTFSSFFTLAFQAFCELLYCLMRQYYFSMLFGGTSCAIRNPHP